VIAFTETMQEELNGTGVTMSVVSPAIVRTELTSGVPLHGASTVDPDDVAAAILACARTGAVERSVPRWAAPAGRAFAALPPPLTRNALRLLGGRRVLDDLDVDARAAYDARLPGNL
ncbi:MAG TPA: oxidoreductase, partial [Marmoricola sp.]